MPNMSPIQRFFQFAPRENSGATTSARYDYQKHWALCKLLELHLTSNDYLVILEYHDDVVVMNSEEAPTQVDFYQIKSKKSGAMSINDLTKLKEGESLSIIGKLYDHKIKFENETATLNLVSNARYKLDLSTKAERSEDKEKICCQELSAANLKKMQEALIKEHKLTTTPQFETVTFLLFSNLTLDDFETHVKGKLAGFFDQLFPGKKISVSEIYKSILSEINLKTNKALTSPDLKELKAAKGIGRSDFEKIVKVIESESEDKWARIESRLNTKSMNFNLVRKLRQEWIAYCVERSDYANRAFSDFRLNVKEVIASVELAQQSGNLASVIAKAKEEYKKKQRDIAFRRYELSYLDVAILDCLYE